MRSLQQALLNAGVGMPVATPAVTENDDDDASTARFHSDVEVMYIQFSFGNRHRLPRWLWQDDCETPVQRQERKARVGGVQIIEKTPGVHLSNFVENVLESDLWLVNAFEIPRINQNDSKGTYYMVRFSFARNRKGLGDKFLSFLDTRGADALRDMVRDTWRVRAYRNPLLHEGVPVPGKFMLSVNCEVPAPLNGKFASTNLVLEDGWPVIR